MEEFGTFWEKHRDVIRGMFAPVTHALIEDAEIGSEDSVLDVATGPGEPALSVAALVGLKAKFSALIRFRGWWRRLAVKWCGWG
jgi:hypothetical protein